MSPLARRRDDSDETRVRGAELELDLDEKACAVCRRDVPVWRDVCPDCGGAAVRRVDLPAEEDSLLSRLMTQDLLVEDEQVPPPAERAGE